MTSWRDAIKGHRRSRSWSQAELGRRARPHNPISHTTISGIETGRTDPQISTLEDIARAFGLTLGDLIDAGAPTRANRVRHQRSQIVGQVGREVQPEVERLVGAIYDAIQRHRE
jgi:transcriptional regulator with XRE-family HTH domain